MKKAYHFLHSIFIISFTFGCSSPGLTQFGNVQKLPLENGRFVNYVLNGHDSCFESYENGVDTYTIFYGNLDSLIYGLSDKIEKWKFSFDQSDITHIKVTPLMDKIQYEEAFCTYNPIFPFHSHGFTQSFLSIRFKKKPNNANIKLTREEQHEK